MISAAGSAAIAVGGGGWESALAFSIAGVFVDLDHFLDYWRETGLNLDLRRFFSYFSSGHPSKLYLILHAWEWCGLAFAAWALLQGPAWVCWGLLGWFQHLLLDQRFNRLHAMSYFFFFRARHRFHSRILYGKP